MHTAIAWLHYLFIMLMMGSLMIEFFLLRQKLDEARIKSLALADLLYGITALLVLLSGLLRFMYFGKGSDYYLVNPVFHIKLTLFILVGLLSVYPTVHFLRWRKAIRNDSAFLPEARMAKRFGMIVAIEILVVALIPLLAVLVNRGYGL